METKVTRIKVNAPTHLQPINGNMSGLIDRALNRKEINDGWTDRRCQRYHYDPATEELVVTYTGRPVTVEDLWANIGIEI